MMTLFKGIGWDTERTGLGGKIRSVLDIVSSDKHRNRGLRGNWIYESELQGTNLSWRFESHPHVGSIRSHCHE